MRLFFIILILLLSALRGVAQAPTGRSYPKPDSLLKMLESYYTDSVQPVSPTSFRAGINVDDRVRATLLRLVEQEWPPAALKARVEKDFHRYFETLYLQHILDTAAGLYHRRDAVYDSVYKVAFDSIAAQLLKDSNKISPATLQTITQNMARDQASAVAGTYAVSYDSIYRAIYDSSARWFKNRRARELRDGPVADEIVLAVARSRITEAIPFLKKDLEKSTVHRYTPKMAELALAALGDPVYKEKYFAQHRQEVSGEWQPEQMNFDFDGLALIIGTQESVALLADWMDTSRAYKMFSEQPNDPRAPMVYSSGHLLPALLTVVRNKDLALGVERLNKRSVNLPPDLAKSGFLDEYEINAEQIHFVKRWLLANKGKYLFY